MPKSYHHLTYDLRCQIYVLKSRGTSNGSIAKQLGFDKSTIGRELKRNSGQRGYRYKQAHEKAVVRRQQASLGRTKIVGSLKASIEEKLLLKWSPAQISGWLSRNGDKRVSHETLYQHVWEDKRRGGGLYRHLRHHGKKYNKRSGVNAGRGCIPGRVDISQRPLVVESKRFGDWEVDTIIGKGHQGAIVSMVERHSKYTVLVKVTRKTSEEVSKALISGLMKFKGSILTLTADNGKEFADHSTVSQSLKADFYFARPYHSWERGLNEHTNGLVRGYLPKTTDFLYVTDEEIKMIENALNQRPRKILGYQSPAEVFYACLQQAG